MIRPIILLVRVQLTSIIPSILVIEKKIVKIKSNNKIITTSNNIIILTILPRHLICHHSMTNPIQWNCHSHHRQMESNHRFFCSSLQCFIISTKYFSSFCICSSNSVFFTCCFCFFFLSKWEFWKSSVVLSCCVCASIKRNREEEKIRRKYKNKVQNTIFCFLAVFLLFQFVKYKKNRKQLPN